MPQALQKLRGAQSITSFSSYCSPPKSGRFLLLCRRAEGLFKSLITIQYDYTMQSANFSIPISAQICNISMNAATLHRIICPPTAKFKQEDLQNRKRTGKQGKAVPTLLPANLRTLPTSHLASKVAWSHFSLVGEICPQAPLNDFCKIGCAPAELSSPAARQKIAALCEYIIDTFSVSGYT